MNKTYRVTFEIEVPADAPSEDVEAFLRFELGEVASLSGTNALAGLDIQSCQVSNVFVD